MPKMKAAVFIKAGRIVVDGKPVPDIGPLDALLRITTATICGTDIHILKGEYPVVPRLTLGHEPVGVIEKLGSSVTGFREGQRVIASAITPSGHSSACLCGCLSQDGPNEKHGFKAIYGWKFGNTIDGCQAEFVRVPDAMVNLAPVPDELSDEQVLMCPDIMSTGFSGAERASVKVGDTVAIFAQGPIGLLGAKLCGATTIITVDPLPERLAMSRTLGAGHVVNLREADPVAEIERLTEGCGVDSRLRPWEFNRPSNLRCGFSARVELSRASGFTRPISPYHSRLSAPAFRSSQRFVQEVRSVGGALCRQSRLGASICGPSSPIGSNSIRSSKPMSSSAISGMAC